ncbi:MAG: hypothetical protein AAGF95_24795 [Chloroflexota bacterium]
MRAVSRQRHDDFLQDGGDLAGVQPWFKQALTDMHAIQHDQSDESIPPHASRQRFPGAFV